MRYEYKVVWELPTEYASLEDWFNELGKHGWKLIDVKSPFTFIKRKFF